MGMGSTRIRALAVLALAGCAIGYAIASVAGARPHHGPCDKVVSSATAAAGAVRGAKPGRVICLANGSYGRLSLRARKGSTVTLRARHPGRATIHGANLAGRHLALTRFKVTSDINVLPGSSTITITFNRISGGYFGVNAGPTTSTNITDTTIRHNKFVGPFGEDAIRLNRYHDGPDRDPYGILIEANEITGVRENGNHSDCLQSVWGGRRPLLPPQLPPRQPLPGFLRQGSAPRGLEHRLQAEPDAAERGARAIRPAWIAGEPAIWQVFGPTAGIRLSHNTIWTTRNESPLTLREGPFGRLTMTDNVIFRVWSDWRGGFPRFTAKDNVICRREGTFPADLVSTRRTCKPRVREAHARTITGCGTADDGVTWRPAKQHYGP